MTYKNDHLETIKEEYEKKFDDHRKRNKEEMEKFINQNLGELLIRQIIQQLSLIDLFWDFDAVSLYLSATSDEKLTSPGRETGHAFTPDMRDELVKKFNEGNFTQGSAILEEKFIIEKT